MPTTNQAAQFRLRLDAGPDADPEEQDRLLRRLRQEILGLDVDAVAHVHLDTAPPDAKGDSIAMGTLVVTLAPLGDQPIDDHTANLVVSA